MDLIVQKDITESRYSDYNSERITKLLIRDIEMVIGYGLSGGGRVLSRHWTWDYYHSRGRSDMTLFLDKMWRPWNYEHNLPDCTYSFTSGMSQSICKICSRKGLVCPTLGLNRDTEKWDKRRREVEAKHRDESS